MEDPRTGHPTRALIHLDRLSHNMRLLQDLVGERRLWPAIKANAYGHDAPLVGKHLVGLGYETLCVAHAEEAVALAQAGVRARFVALSASLPEQSERFAEHDLEAVGQEAQALDATDGLVTPPDATFPVQMTGSARLADGTVLGGIRHQFRGENGGTRAFLTVEFPWLTGPIGPAAHRWHLASEFSTWIEAAAAARS